VTIPAIVEHLESVVGALPTPPIIIGHSAGGAFTQILLDHGFGAAGVALNSAPTEGVPVVPLSQVKSTFPVLKNPANRHKAFDDPGRRYAFGWGTS
jgi:pimeloyl-ACP methyl ester carboxylesterase